MDKLQFFFDTLAGEPKALMGSPNNDMVMINCLNELRAPEEVNVKISEKEDSKALSADELKNQICELIESVFEEKYFDNLNDEILKTQINALELSLKFGNNQKLLNSNFQNIYAMCIYLNSSLVNKTYVLTYLISLLNENINESSIIDIISSLLEDEIISLLTKSNFDNLINNIIKILSNKRDSNTIISRSIIAKSLSKSFLLKIDRNYLMTLYNLLIEIILDNKEYSDVRTHCIDSLTENFINLLDSNQINKVFEILIEFLSEKRSTISYFQDEEFYYTEDIYQDVIENLLKNDFFSKLNTYQQNKVFDILFNNYINLKKRLLHRLYNIQGLFHQFIYQLSNNEFDNIFKLLISLFLENQDNLIRNISLEMLSQFNIINILNHKQFDLIFEILILVLEEKSEDTNIRSTSISSLKNNNFLIRLNENKINSIIDKLLNIIINQNEDDFLREYAIKFLLKTNILIKLNENKLKSIAEILLYIATNPEENNYIIKVSFENLFKLKSFSEKDDYKLNKNNIKNIFKISNEFSPITLGEKDENRKKEIQEQTKKYQALNHKLFIYYFNDPELKDEFKKYSMKYNIVYYEKTDGWYCFDNHLEEEIKVPKSFNEELQKTQRYKIINEILDSIPKYKTESLEEMIKDDLQVEQMVRYSGLNKEQVESYISKIIINKGGKNV